MEDDQFLATYRPRRQLTDHEQHCCRRALPRMRQWAQENRGKYATPELAANVCGCVIATFLAGFLLVLAEDILADLVLSWIKAHWHLLQG